MAMGNVSAAELRRVTCATLGLVFGQVLSVDDQVLSIDEMIDKRKTGLFRR